MSFFSPHPYSTPILGVFPLHQNAHVGSVRTETLSYSAVQLILKYSNLCENHTSTSQIERQTTCNLIIALCVASRGKKTRIIGYTLPLIAWIYLSWNFHCGLRNNSLFLQEGRFSRSRLSKVINIGANRKHVCDFLLVRNSNLGIILHRFGELTAFMCSWPHPYFPLILGCSRCIRSPVLGLMWAGTLSYLGVKLFSKNSNLYDHGT